MGISPYSARGLKQSFAPIQQAAQLRRTISGVLIDLSQPEFRLFKSTISGGDQRPPAFAGMWPGMPVSVENIAELGAVDGAPDRAVAGTWSEDGVTYVRYALDMLIMGWNVEQDEYGASVSWSLDLEEAAPPVA